MTAVPLNLWEIWLTKMDFGRPNAEIGWKMANGQLILTLVCVGVHVCGTMHLLTFTQIHAL